MDTIPRFWKCLLASAAAHAALLLFLVQNPIWLASLWHSLFGKFPSRTIDLLAEGEMLQEPDTTFDVILTKRPDSKPFDLPQTTFQEKETLDILQREAIASFFELPDPLADLFDDSVLQPSSSELAKEELPCITLEQPAYEAALAELPIPVLEMPIDKTIEMPSMFFAAVANLHLPVLEAIADQKEEPLVLSTTPLPFSFEDDQLASFVRASTTMGKEPGPKNQEMFSSDDWQPLSSLPPLEDAIAVSSPTASLELESLELPPTTITLPTAKEKLSYSSILPAPPSTDSQEKGVAVSPKREALTAVDAKYPFSPESTPQNFTQSATSPMAKPRLSTSTILVDEALNYPPLFAFGNDRIPPIRNYGLPEIGSIVEWKNLFAIDVHVMPRKNEEDVIFSVVLTPKKEAAAYALKQNFHFVIDCTSKSSRYRIPIYKRAVERALGYLEPKQSFNIYLLDDQGVAFQDEPVPGEEKQIARARTFLEKQSHKTPRQKRDLLRVLKHVAELPQGHDELHTVVLLSDGHLFDKNKKKKDEFYSWLRAHSGKLVLYAATVGQEDRAIDLELFAASSGSSVLVTTTNASFTRKFAKMVMDLRYPIAQVVAADLRSKNPDQPFAFPSEHTILPPLYAGQTYTFVGTSPAPEDFTFNLEAITKGRFVEINQQLSLKTASKPHSSLTTLWLKNKARGELAQYLDLGEDRHIERAAKLLSQADSR